MNLNNCIIILISIVIILIIVKPYSKNEYFTTTTLHKHIRLCTQYYLTDLKKRQKEIDDTLIQNINNDVIDEIILFIEKDYNFDTIKKKVNNFNKVTLVHINERLTFKICFDYCNKHMKDNTINILANSDIYFNKTLANLYTINLDKTFLALTRYDLPDLKMETNSKGCQDTWIWTSPLQISKKKSNKDYFNNGIPLGLWGCDIRIIKIIQDEGYTIKNLCKKIITIHNHSSNTRENNRKTLPGPYLYIPCE